GEGPKLLFAALQRVSIELAVGRIEDASDNRKEFDKPEVAAGIRSHGMMPMVEWLKYQKAVLAGEYKTAGDLWESIAGRQIDLFKNLPPPGPSLSLAGPPFNMATKDLEDMARLVYPPAALRADTDLALTMRFWYLHWLGMHELLRQRVQSHLSAESNFFYRRG